MRTRSKLVSALMSLVLVVSICPAPAIASEPDIQSARLTTQAVARTKVYQDSTNNCVLWARKQVPSLPYGLNTLQDKKNIINGHTAVAGSVAVMDGVPASVGHVAVVTAVNGDRITVRESNWIKNWITEATGTASQLGIYGYYVPAGLSIPDSNRDPIGAFDECWGGPQLRIRGWAFDPDSPDRAVGIHVYVGGPAGSGASCYTVDSNGNGLLANNVDRPDIGRRCGFDYTLAVNEWGAQPVYVYAINNEGGNNPLLSNGLKTVHINADPYGFMDECEGGVGTVRVSGWVYDGDSYDTPVKLHVYIGGPAGSGASCYTTDSSGNALVANMDRPDLGKACGFDYILTVRERGGQPVYVYAINNEGGNNPLLRNGPKTVAISNPGSSGEPVHDTAQPMHRLYNEWTGEHFYTSSDSERDSLAGLGWSYEGVGWNAPAAGDDVYRLYNQWTGEHHFTTSAAEKDACVSAGWTDEGVGWKSGGTAPVYREYNPYAAAFSHNYTASREEHDWLVSIGWRDEGVGWYGTG